MIVNHRHIAEEVRANKKQVILTDQNPLILLFSKKATFLNESIIRTLDYFAYPYKIKWNPEPTAMDYNLPLISYKNAVVESESLIEFLCDIAMSELDITQFIERKQNLKRLYKIWYQIINRNISSNLSQIKQLQTYTNLVGDELINLLISMANGGNNSIYERRGQSFCLEKVVFCDLIEVLLNQNAEQLPDYLIRSNFWKLIEAEKAERNKNIRPIQKKIPTIILWEDVTENKTYPKVTWNTKWFLTIFVGISLIFIKWGK